jgi:hypothetical protein
MGLAWAKGVAPMKCGDIAVSWARNGENVKATITSDTRGRIYLQVDHKRMLNLTFDGKEYASDSMVLGGTHVLEWREI